MERALASSHANHERLREDSRRRVDDGAVVRIGTSSTPLLGDTIGDNLDRTIARVRRPRGAGLGPSGPALHVLAVRRGRRALPRARSSRPDIEPGERVGIWSPNCAEWALVQYGTAKAGIILVNINPAYRTSELAYVLNQSGVKMLVAATAFKTSDYVKMVDDVRGDCDEPRAGRVHRARLGGVHRRRRAGHRRRAARAPGRDRSSTTRSTSSTRAAPRASRRARRSATTTSSTTATSSAAAAATPRRTGSASRCPTTTASAWSWATSRARRTAPAWSSRRPRSTPSRRCRPCRTRTARRSTACRRCSSPSSSTRRSPSSTSRRLRTGIMAGSPCPIETMKRCVSEMHMEEVTICYGMTETSPVSTQTGADDPLEKRVGHRRARAPARRGQGRRRPRTARSSRAASPASCARAPTA